MNYLYGFASAVFVYWALSYCFPARESLLEACIYDDPDIIDSVDSAEKSEQDSYVVQRTCVDLSIGTLFFVLGEQY